jgi:hypothetical protein
LAKSSADSIGVNILSTVRKAARLAVYEEIMIRVKNHQTLPTILPDTDLNGKKENTVKSRQRSTLWEITILFAAETI